MQTQRQIAVFGSFLTPPQSYECRMAEELGHLLAKNGFKIMCGGHGGIVAALVSGAMRGGGEVIGVSLAEGEHLKRNAKMNPHLAETVIVNTISERLEYFVKADGYIFFNGGIGSIAEFAFIWHALQVEGIFDRPLICISGAWKRFLAEIRREQMVKHKYYRQLHVCERAKDALAVVTNDYSLKYDDPDNVFYKECVLFDLDGTIVESPEEEFINGCENIGYFFHLPDVAESFRRARLRSAPQGQTATRDDISFHLDVLEKLGIDSGPATDIAGYLNERAKRIPDLYDDVVGTLRYFKGNGFSTGTISTRHPLQLREILAAHDLSGLFDFVGSLDCSAEKPVTGQLAEAMELHGCRTEGIMYVGDKCRNEYFHSLAMDVDSILLDRHLSHILDDKTFKIRSLRELKFIIGHRGAGRGTC